MGQRLIQFFTPIVLLLFVWVLLLQEIINLPVPEYITTYLPFWALVAFGVYSVLYISYSVLTFRDCPEAYASLQKEIQEAKSELKKQKITA